MKERRKMLTSKEAAKELKITRQTLSRYKLPKKIRIGNRDYYSEKDIEDILQNGLENYLQNVEKQCDNSIDARLSELSSSMLDHLVELLQGGQFETFMRIMFEFDSLSELMQLVMDCEYTALYETNDPDMDETIFSPIDFFPCVDAVSYEDQLATLADMANDPNNHIVRYGIMPTTIFRAIYREYLFFVYLESAEVAESEKANEKQRQLLDYMMPFRAEYGKKVIAKKTE